MKKKLLATALIATMVLSMTACGGKEDAEPSNTPTTEQQVQEQTQENEQDGSEEVKADAVEIKEEDLGPLLDQLTFTAESEDAHVYLNFPTDYSKGRESLYYHMTYDTEDTETIALVGYLSDYDYKTLLSEVGITEYTIENVLPVHSRMFVDSIDYNYGAKYADFAMEISEGELVNVNETEMCKHTGTLTYTVDGAAVEKSVVGYSIPASNGSYVFFVVCSLDAEKAENDANFIAQTARETRDFE